MFNIYNVQKTVDIKFSGLSWESDTLITTIADQGVDLTIEFTLDETGEVPIADETLKAKYLLAKNIIDQNSSIFFDKRDEAFYKTDEFMSNRHKYAAVVNNSQKLISEKIEEALPLVKALYLHMKNVNIPEDILSEEGNYITYVELMYVLSDRLKGYYDQALEHAQIAKNVEFYDLLKEFIKFLEKYEKNFNNLMRERKKAKQQASISKDKTKELTNNLKDKTIIIEEKINILAQLCDSAYITKDTQTKYAETLIELINQKQAKLFVDEANRILQDIDKNSYTTFINQVGDGFYGGLSEWRSDDLPPITKEQFIKNLSLYEIQMSISSSNNRFEHLLFLYVKEKDDSFAGHFMCARVEDAKITELSLMG
ncbi:hypothetical protein [Desulfovibrio litoralis]|uniref:DUF2262 domain-containing protein n=1 Tax=Desulfovibrio litoralis DSM 11393 TaxID=1121455 RepID=A0A1M7SH81_9BACT|nr:hypothetical protein [Desulfovibrio litoralis]SHN57801.1 hypothetical protein SAMN02745728_00951 [Desulfovibrio litoralis DSM 11393]